jgi:hypothetical protein
LLKACGILKEKALILVHFTRMQVRKNHQLDQEIPNQEIPNQEIPNQKVPGI